MKKDVIYQGAKIGEIEASGENEADARAAYELLQSFGHTAPYSLFEQIIGQANCFAEVAQQLYRSGLTKPPFKGSSTPPFVVNGVLSVELYLKALRTLRGESVRGHNLLELYKGICDEHKHVLVQAAKDIRPLYKIDSTSVVTCFKSIADSFSQWRYVYEFNGISAHLQMILYCMHFCHDSCKRIYENADQENSENRNERTRV